MSAPPHGGLFRRRARPRAATTEDLILTVVGLIVGFLLGVTLLFWGTGKLSARIFSGQWPDVGLVEMGPIMVSTLQNPGNPAAAWPPGSQALIPSAFEFYLVMLVLFLIPAAILIALLFALLRDGPMSFGLFGGGRIRRSSAFARNRDLRHLFVSGPQPGRLTLGRVNGKLVAAEPGQSVIVLGPSGSMKTGGFAVPSILEWQGPVVAASMEANLILDTLDRRRNLGSVYVYDPTASTSLPRSGWTPLAQAETWAEALRTAGSLASAAQEGARRDRDADLHLPDTSSLIAPLLFAAANTNRVMGDVVRWVQRREKDQVSAALEAAGEPAAADAIEGVWRLDERQQSELYRAAQLILGAYADPLVAESARISQLNADALLDGDWHTAYLTAPAHELERIRPLFSALLHEIITTAYERVVETGQPLDPPLLLVLDDAADLGAVRALDVYASTAHNNGIQLVSIFNDLSQIKSRYGERGDTVVNNHRARVIMSGTSDSETMEYVANLLGDEETRQVMSTFGDEGSYSATEMSSYRRITPADVLREIQPGEGLLIYGYSPPAELTLRPWFRDRELRELAGSRRKLGDGDGSSGRRRRLLGRKGASFERLRRLQPGGDPPARSGPVALPSARSARTERSDPVAARSMSDRTDTDLPWQGSDPERTVIELPDSTVGSETQEIPPVGSERAAVRDRAQDGTDPGRDGDGNSR